MRWKPMREMRIDSPPAAGEVGIAWRQRPDGMQVFRQDDDGVDRERALVPRDAECRPQGADMVHQC
jgi:hypothetical protein